MKLSRAPQRTTPGFAFSMLGRALKDCLATRQFGRAEMREVLAFFGADPPTCVYCGSPDTKRWDHLIPVNQDGETVLGNMVPACARCDDSKRDVPFAKWMRSDAKNSPRSREIANVDQRIQRIQAYIQHFGYQVRPLNERLNAQELAHLVDIQQRMQTLRQDMDALIQEYRARTGNS